MLLSLCLAAGLSTDDIADAFQAVGMTTGPVVWPQGSPVTEAWATRSSVRTRGSSARSYVVAPAAHARRGILAVAVEGAPAESVVMIAASIVEAALAPVQQSYLLEARQMQALSFAVHIPLVCFGIAFPAMVLLTEWLYLRSGDQLYRTLARRWSKVMIALFAVGVITGTILSFEMGLLWPDFTATFGSVFGLGFALEGFSFFVEAIFIGIYVYGWDRLSPRAHFASGIPVAIAGFTGALMVISVNAWMNHPSGFALRDGKAVHVDLAALLATATCGTN